MKATESVWEALGFNQVEAANLAVRASLMRQIEDIIDKAGWTQTEAAKRCKVSQPRLNDLLRGKVTKFSVDALVKIAVALDQRIELRMERA